MAFPLKSGADLYNNQLIRAAIWNYSADIIEPSELVTGLIYFNTSNSSAGKKLRLYTGSAWKTIAFEEDLDVANNADFQTLKAKVEAFLEGGVDSDGVLNKLSEIQAFLDNYSSATDLTEILDTKLDKTGGEIISKAFGALTINRNLPYASGIKFSNSDGVLGYIGINNDYTPMVWDKDGANAHTLLHSGNANKTDVPWAASNIQFPKGTSATWNVHTTDAYKGITVLNAVQAKPEGAPDHYAVGLSVSGYYGFTLASLGGGDVLLYRRDQKDWKTIAFTDSNVASAQALVHSNGTVGATAGASGGVNINGSLYWDDPSWYTIGSYSESSNVPPFGRYKFYSGHIFQTAKGEAMRINESGNVTIGDRDLAGTGAIKLWVDGNVSFGRSGMCNVYLRRTDGSSYIIANSSMALSVNNSSDNIAMLIKTDKSAVFNGNVGIGTPYPRYKLHVGGDIVATGTIACKGIAAEGDAMDMVDKTVLYIAPSTTQQTFTLNHGLGTREIAISIYEITSMGTNMILTDVEIVDDNNISVSFGNPPTENHMVVVMG